jgi:hypothetical protein
LNKRIASLCAAVVLLSAPAAASSLSTTFVGGNIFDGNMFDVAVGAKNITVTSLDVNVDLGPETIDVYIKTGTYVGFETNSAAWTLVSATPVTGLGAGAQTLVPVSLFTLSSATTYGMYITIDTTVNATPYMTYTSGSDVYSNSDLNITTGAGLGGKFGSLNVIPGRSWNGTINYSVAGTPEPASFTLFVLAAPGFWLLRRPLPHPTAASVFCLSRAACVNK